MKKLAREILAGLRDGIAASLVLAVLYSLAIGGYFMLNAAPRPERDAIDSHRYVDKVLRVKFAAAWNEWTLKHPQDSYDYAKNEPREGEHLTRFDRGDLERWKAAREAFRNLDDAMKKAGY